ncbi:phage integrase N-terminal SAM-like domain-containing protein [Marinomonas fungiae]|uniref:Phage integrase, N-terminal SAM-like domain n=1 Tax=Marinomonas fungiae TaxID=1137284 RepID=A0A0K6IL65_9GAMM|nr:phage integrase N-terminal SAM-like domain-containing protein [Marinomonas fungiae]CUB04067.1 Phage integrase, N-terminal SAM-like domain [Marinomonas fungiae]
MSSSPFMNHLRSELRIRGYSMKTEKSYLYWIRYFIRFHNSTGTPYQCKTKS